MDPLYDFDTDFILFMDKKVRMNSFTIITSSTRERENYFFNQSKKKNRQVQYIQLLDIKYLDKKLEKPAPKNMGRGQIVQMALI